MRSGRENENAAGDAAGEQDGEIGREHRGSSSARVAAGEAAAAGRCCSRMSAMTAPFGLACARGSRAAVKGGER